MVWLIIILAVAFVGVKWIRHWAKESDLPPAGGFTLADLRKLKQEGKMSEDEYKKAAGLIIGAQSAQILSPEKKDPPKVPKR
jgi:hypothetical protein